MIRLNKIIEKPSDSDLIALSYLSEATIDYFGDLDFDSVKRSFNYLSMRKSRVNHIVFTDAYQLILDNGQLKLWHFNVKGDKDKLLATVTKK